MASKKAPAKKAPVKKSPVKKAPAKKAVVKKSAVKKAPAKKAPVKKVAAKKPPVKKAAVKKQAAVKFKGKPKDQAIEVARRLAIGYPEVICELDHRNAFELISATILSAQCTDVRVNMVTPALFARFPDPWSLASADPSEVETLIRSTGFYQSKAKNLMGMAQNLIDRFGGEVPSELSDLVTLPGVGRKTGNVVRSVVFDLPGLPVDTHVGRLSRRLGLTKLEDPVKVELQLNDYLPPAEWGSFSLRLILHGRRVCDARKPQCTICELADICPSAGVPVTAPTTKRSPRKN
jgi:endonuclease-3